MTINTGEALPIELFARRFPLGVPTHQLMGITTPDGTYRIAPTVVTRHRAAPMGWSFTAPWPAFRVALVGCTVGVLIEMRPGCQLRGEAYVAAQDVEPPHTIVGHGVGEMTLAPGAAPRWLRR